MFLRIAIQSFRLLENEKLNYGFSGEARWHIHESSVNKVLLCHVSDDIIIIIF